MENFIEKLQKKSKKTRIKIFWLAIFISVLIIGSLWLISLKASLKNVGQKLAVPQEISNSLENIKEQMPSLKDNFSSNLNSLFAEPTQQEENPFIGETASTSPQ